MPIRLADFYDAELHRHHAHFRAALDVGRRDRVLDVGCGAGQTTRDVAQIAAEGSVVGVDVSDELLQVARQRCADEGLRNVVFERGDAQVHPYPVDYFDLCISRFGVMFFADPAVAFAHIGRALRRDARLVLMVWQSRERNPWSAAIQQALAQDNSPAASGGAFSLADRAVTTRLLEDAGFDSVTFTEVREPVFYGPTVDAAFTTVAGLFDSGEALIGTNAAAKAARQRLEGMLRNHLTADGVLFDSCSWLITARRA